MTRSWTRRELLGSLAAGAATLPVGGLRPAFGANATGLVLRLTAERADLPARPGAATRGLRYRGEVLRGRGDAIGAQAGNLGPTLELRRGERVRIEVVNRTDEPAVIHWHGLIVPDSADGHPHHAIAPGASYTVEFTVRNPPGTYLYHPHTHHLTGAQTYRGLAGLLIVRDGSERGIGLPSAQHELPLVLQDRRFTADNQLVFKNTMMDSMMGVLGDRVLVNGVEDPGFKVAPRGYRLRIANASNARIYKLAWSDQRPMRVIASDGGLFSGREGVQERPYVTLFPFQRVELLEGFGERRSGSEVALVSQEFDGAGLMMSGNGGMMGGGMMSRMMGMMGPSQGQPLHLARFSILPGPRSRPDVIVLPQHVGLPEAVHDLRTQLAFRHMRGFLNGRSFDERDPMAVADDERLPAGRTSIWTFENDGPGMPMPHPMHIHGVQFRVVERSGNRAPSDLREGVIDAGWQDTFGIFAGERVRVALAPPVGGLFMYHCHNLEHEDGGMMRNCLFES